MAHVRFHCYFGLWDEINNIHIINMWCEILDENKISDEQKDTVICSLKKEINSIWNITYRSKVDSFKRRHNIRKKVLLFCIQLQTYINGSSYDQIEKLRWTDILNCHEDGKKFQEIVLRYIPMVDGG